VSGGATVDMWGVGSGLEHVVGGGGVGRSFGALKSISDFAWGEAAALSSMTSRNAQQVLRFAKHSN